MTGIEFPQSGVKYCNYFTIKFADAPLTPGRESWEKSARQQTISDGWFALESRISPERVAVSVEKEKLLQFYSAFAAVPPTMEWMSKLVTLKPGERWTVREVLSVVVKSA